MAPHELDAVVSVWQEANIARGALVNSERTARVYEKLTAIDAATLVAARADVVGMTLLNQGALPAG